MSTAASACAHKPPADRPAGPVRRDRRRVRVRALLLAVVAALAPPASAAASILEVPTDRSEVETIATDAYVYAYPLVLMELTRRTMTNVGEGAPAAPALHAPMNRFGHLRAFPDPTVTAVARPEADTLASSLWFDVSAEPLVIEVPDSEGRYYLLSMHDLWSDVFAAPGKRTSGTGRQTYAVTGPGWTGMLPAGVERIAAPTSVGWVVARVQTNGPDDVAAVHRFQDGLRAVALSAWGTDAAPPAGTFDPARPRRPPVEQIAKLAVGDFFARFAELTRTNPPHAHDGPILQRMARLGLVPGRPFVLASAPPEVQAAMRGAVMAASSRLFDGVKRAGTLVNGWRVVASPMGTYGTDYLRRMVVAYGGLGAPVLEDAVVPSTTADAERRPLDSAERYVIRFPPGQLPPVHGFWSITLYDERQLLAPNPIKRYAIGDRDALAKNADGSLELYVQRASPGPAKAGNWLPAPQEGRFSLTMRLSWPKPAVLDGTWAPPPIVRVRE